MEPLKAMGNPTKRKPIVIVAKKYEPGTSMEDPLEACGCHLDFRYIW